MNRIFEPFELKSLKLKNRIVMSPMCMHMAVDGFANDWHYTHYGTRSVGGVGLVIIEATGVLPEGRITVDDLGIWREEHVEPLKRIVDFNHSQGSAIGIQLGHAGRKSVVKDDDASGPSAIPFDDQSPMPHEMDQNEINLVVNAFAEGARRALKAGFDVIEIHGAHGYLISEFLSPLCNHRTDQYGGSLANRFRFLSEVISAVKKVWPADKALLLRLSADEYAVGGSNIREKVEIAKQAKAAGVDLIDVSSGGVVPTTMDVYPGYQVDFSQKIKTSADIATIAGGLVVTEEQVQEILFNDRSDLVFLGRELLRNPYFVLTLNNAKEEVSWPKPYERARR